MLRRVTAAGGLLAVLAPAAIAVAPAAHADDLALIRQLGNDLRAARQITTGTGVTVAIISTGVDGSVGSLRGKVKPGKDFTGVGHAKNLTGTLLASLIAGAGLTHYSPVGMRGLASGSDILPVRVGLDPQEPGYDRFYDSQGYGQIEAKGIRYAVDQGAQVLCITTHTWDNESVPVRAALSYALAKNVTVVAGAAPIVPDDSPAFPAAEPGVIGVGALDLKGHRIAGFSSRNSSVLIGAPGVAFPSIGPGNSPWTIRGTLPAAAWVASTAAMVRAEHPKFTQAQVAQAITSSAHHPTAGYNTETGYGTINPIGALRAAQALEGKPPITGGRAGLAEGAHFGGHRPAKIHAVQHDQGLLAGSGGLAATGLLTLALALYLTMRRRRPTTAGPVGPAAPSPAPASPDAAPTPGDALSPDGLPEGQPGGGLNEHGPQDAPSGRTPGR